jgi:hypothetical protein
LLTHGCVGEIDLAGCCTNTMRRNHDETEFVHPSPFTLESGAEGLPLDELQHDEARAVVRAAVVDRDDVGVVKTGGVRLTLEG